MSLNSLPLFIHHSSVSTHLSWVGCDATVQRHVLKLRHTLRLGRDGDARSKSDAETHGGRLRCRERGIMRSTGDGRVVMLGRGAEKQRGPHHPPFAVRHQSRLGGDVAVDDGAVGAVPLQLLIVGRLVTGGYSVGGLQKESLRTVKWWTEQGLSSLSRCSDTSG